MNTCQMKYPWYECVNDDEQLEQGDIITECPVLIPGDPNQLEQDEISGEIEHYNVIIMSHSCDIANNKLNLILACPIYGLADYETSIPELKNPGGKEALRKGKWNSLHLLNKCDCGDYKGQFIVVDFRNVHGIPHQMLRKAAKRQNGRIRLLPPYREQLAQRFGVFFMRIGFPVDIPPFK